MRILLTVVVVTSLLPLLASRPPQAKETFVTAAHGRDEAPMVRIPAGAFIMGSDKDGEPDERPKRTVNLPAYWMDLHEVTNVQYARFCRESGHKTPVQWEEGAFKQGQDEWPVVNVTWEDAAAYAAWAGKRLPSEAEWEKAARGTDGRTYPWGAFPQGGSFHNLGFATLDDEKEFGPVSRYPKGASPYGCLDMAGNAWEWTADWYNAYPRPERPTPQTEMVMTATYSPYSPHFGTKYKVVRGGGAIGYYGIPNTHRCADRARMLPFAGYDGTGFRCAMDDEAAARATPNPKVEVEKTLVPDPPSVKAVKPALGSSVVLTVREPIGVARTDEIVTSGVPFAQGALKDPGEVQLVDEDGNDVPLQLRVTDRWPDQSIKWLLLKFPCSVGRRQSRVLNLNFWARIPSLPSRSISPPEFFVQTNWEDFNVAIDGVLLSATASQVPSNALHSVERDFGERLTYEVADATVLAAPTKPHSVQTRVRTEVLGISRRDHRAYRDLLLKFDLTELTKLTKLTEREPPEVKLADTVQAFTISNRNAVKIQPLTGWSVMNQFPCTASPTAGIFGGDRPYRFRPRPGETWELVQETGHSYKITRNGAVVSSGMRAAGWVTLYRGYARRTICLRDFWQQSPMALVVDKKGISVRFWAGKEPFELDHGLEKTIEVLSTAGPATETGEAEALAFQHPLFAVAPPEWYCGTGALGELAPYDHDRFPEYETPVEADLDIWMRSRPYGFRNWGDAYMGGEFKGKNAYNNLEYDIPYDFFMQFARTGNRKYLEAGIVGARHQSDIDTNHVTGQPWKHSPRHTETPAELGHVFLRGLIEYTHFTGDPRGLDTAKLIGDWLCKEINNRGATCNERQIGWGLYALTAVYEATQDEKYLKAMKTFVDRLVAEQEPTGKFNIRYDNRIAFFNGLAMAGLRRYYELTGDEKVANAVLRLADRTLGMYPEYAGRTLDGLAWAYDRTGDRRYLTALARTWETTLEYCRSRGWGPGTTLFATRYLAFLARHGLTPKPENPLKLSPAQLATENGLYLTQIPMSTFAMLIRDDSGEAFDIDVIRHGNQEGASLFASAIWPMQTSHPENRGAWAFWNANGAPRGWNESDFGQMTLPPSPQEIRRGRIPIRKGRPGRFISLCAASSGTKVWDIITTRPLPRVIQTDDLIGIDRMTPRIYFKVTGSKLAAKLEAIGEGFHGALLYDPEGRPVKTVSQFIDLGDKGAYSLNLTAAIPAAARGRVWSMDIQDAKLQQLNGAEHYFASTRGAYFDPNSRK